MSITRFNQFNKMLSIWALLLDLQLIDIQGVPEIKIKNVTKSRALGLNFTINMTWEGLIRLRRSDRKLIARHKGRLLIMIEPVHCGSNSILKVRFFWDTLYIQRDVALNLVFQMTLTKTSRLSCKH